MKTFLVILFAAISVPALAQVSDNEITAAHVACDKPENRSSDRLRRLNEPPAPYKEEWKKCEQIDAEYVKRDLAKKSRDAEVRSNIEKLLQKLGN